MRAERLAEPGAEEEYREIQMQLMLGEDIIRARQARGWAQRDLAKAAGVRVMDVDAVELGDLDGRLGIVERVAKALDMELKARLELTPIS
jgi:ribosome-binding protein aMBF1 (putative translation factor)